MAESKWLRIFHQSAARTELVCFPPAGGAASAYHALSGALTPAVQVLAVQYPGRQDRLGDRLIESIDDFACAAAAEVKQRSGKPIAVFGHSMGATVAFETARALEAAGLELTHLFVSGRIPPHRSLGTSLHKGSDNDLLDRLEKLANEPEQVQMLRDMPEIAEMILPAVRSDYKAVETYQFSGDTPCLSCPLSVFVSEDDPTVTLDEAKEWERYSRGPFTLEVFPGRHFYLDVHTAKVAESIRRRL